MQRRVKSFIPFPQNIEKDVNSNFFAQLCIPQKMLWRLLYDSISWQVSICKGLYRFVTTKLDKYIFETLCAIWYQLYNLKTVKNTHGGVLLLLKLQAEATTSNTVPWVFLTFLKLCKWYQIAPSILPNLFKINTGGRPFSWRCKFSYRKSNSDFLPSFPRIFMEA